MNRQKKLRTKFADKLKRAHAKRYPKKKTPYISKADRALLEQKEEASEQSHTEIIENKH